MKMASSALVLKILFLVLIAHSSSIVQALGSRAFPAGDEQLAASKPADGQRQVPDVRQDTRTTQRSENAQDSQQEARVWTTAGGTTPVSSEELARSSKASDEGAKGRDQSSESQVNYAELCYLSNGGSSLTLTVNEATQVGSIIGTVEVNGDPALDTGNVDLSDSPEAGEEPWRRQLGRRSAAAPAVSLSRGNRTRWPPPPPPSLPLGLVSDTSVTHSSHFYSLLAATPAPVGPLQQAVRLEPGTKSLVLARPLDKESVEGEQSLVLSVRCSPRGSRQDASSIPVRIIVTDANDHGPEFLGHQPYVVNISETAPAGSVASRDILALDRDSAGPFSTLHYRVLDGPAHAQLLTFANPLEPTLTLTGPLDYEALSSFTLTIQAQDQGEPEPQSATAQVLVNVLDFDDQNPRFLDDKYILVMDETQQNLVGQNLQVLPRNLYAEDGDRGINAPIVYSFASPSDSPLAAAAASTPNPMEPPPEPTAAIEHYLHLNPTSGEIRLLRQWPNKWAGLPLTLVVRATQADNKDRYTLTTLTIVRPAVTSSGSHSVRPNMLARSDEPNITQGIEFTPDRLSISVPESVAINDKIARVRARYLSKDLVDNQAVDLVGASTASSIRVGRTRTGESPPQRHRPIHYQILDDQTDQFAINGLGEIMVKRPLDYELRQEYKFRVLATYTKFSDICHVQVSVLNVNDNKPKFTQPQYTFVLTESRLRSNLLGSVQALDADLNDTIQYSLAGEHAHLFEISASGQFGLRAPIKQFNLTSCQFTVLATDSLGPPIHTHQARVTVQVAPQLLGRSLNFDQQSSGSDLFNSRILHDQLQTDQSGSSGGPTMFSTQRLSSGTTNKDPPGPSSQRSSVATVMSSLQHMVRSVNLFDMPMSSALLLSALLAFLICLLFIVVISMSVHFYRRHSKLRHRHHLVSAAHLRHAHIASVQQDRSRYLSQANSNLSSSSGSNSSPRESTQAGSSPQFPQPPANYDLGPQLTGKHIRGSMHLAGSLQSQLEAPSQQKVASTRNQILRPPESDEDGKGTPAGRPKTATPSRQYAEESQVWSLSSHSKRSYRSNTTDDSSVMHCGHYSVTAAPSLGRVRGSLSPEKLVKQQACSSVEAAIKSLVRHNAEGSNSDPNRPPSQTKPTLNTTQSNELSELTSSKPNIKSYKRLPFMGSLVRPHNRVGVVASPEEMRIDLMGYNQAHSTRPSNGDTTQDSAIASDASSSACSSGQRLDAMARSQEPEQIVPDAARKGLMAMIKDPELRVPSSTDYKELIEAQTNVTSRQGKLEPIRWPYEIIPGRVKKLTWDDGMSVSNEDCFLAPDVELKFPLSPLSNHHQYPVRGAAQDNTGDDRFAEQHFLFSNPCTPTPQGVTKTAKLTDSMGTSPQMYDQSSLNGQDNNCLDYTIVHSSQFHVNSLAADRLEIQRQSLSARHHHHMLQQQHQQQHQQHQQKRPQSGTNQRAPSSYLYSNSFSQPAAANQDLNFITTAVL